MVLILVAFRGELSVKDVPDLYVHYARVWKINASIKSFEIIKDYAPTFIINYGTAFSLNDTLKGLVEVKIFSQRVMDAISLGFNFG